MTYSNPHLIAAWTAWLHLANFALPALVLATLLAPAVAGRHGLSPRGLWRVWCWLAGTGLCVLVAGMVVFGRDGKVATYAALVLSLATVCCWLQTRRPKTAPARAAATDPKHPISR